MKGSFDWYGSQWGALLTSRTSSGYTIETAPAVLSDISPECRPPIETTDLIVRNLSSNIVQTIATCTAGHDKVRVALARERALIRFHQMRQSVLPNLWKEWFTKLSVPLIP